MGDLSQIMPVIHPYTMAATGGGHGVDYLIQDYVQAVINPAKAMAMTVIDLLAGQGRGGQSGAGCQPPADDQAAVPGPTGFAVERGAVRGPDNCRGGCEHNWCPHAALSFLGGDTTNRPVHLPDHREPSNRRLFGQDSSVG